MNGKSGSLEDGISYVRRIVPLRFAHRETGSCLGLCWPVAVQKDRQNRSACSRTFAAPAVSRFSDEQTTRPDKKAKLSGRRTKETIPFLIRFCEFFPLGRFLGNHLSAFNFSS